MKMRNSVFKTLIGLAMLCGCFGACFFSNSHIAPTHADAVSEIHSHDNITFQPWESSTSLPTSGSYYLTCDIVCSSGDSYASVLTGDLNLCLNGWLIKTNNKLSVFYVGVNKTLKIFDCNGTNQIHYYKIKDSNDWILDSYSSTAIPLDEVTLDTPRGNTIVSIPGGSIVDISNNRGVHKDYGEPYGAAIKVDGSNANLFLYSGNIVGGYCDYGGGAIALEDGASFTMEGGRIVGNCGYEAGGIFSRSGCTFIMKDGLIAHNVARYSYGGGVVSFGNTTIDGGSISFNRTKQADGDSNNRNGGGVFVANGTFTLNDGAISNNYSFYNGGGVEVHAGSFVMNGGSIIENRAANGGGGGINNNNRTTTIYGGTIKSNNCSNGIGHQIRNDGGSASMSGYCTVDNARNSAANYDLYYVSTNTKTKLIFNKEGGTGGSDTADIITGQMIPEKISLPTKIGYVFNGYYTGKNGTGTKYYNIDGTRAYLCNWTNIVAEFNLYADWIEYPNWALISDSESGQTLTSGYYTINKDVTTSASVAGTSGLTIAENSIVYIDIPYGMTLTCIGANASEKTGGGAGIYLPESSVLHLLGNGTISATGGDAAQGSVGSNGTNGWFSGNDNNGYYGTNGGGKGGDGGGGAGAGIGTSGGTGGTGGAGGAGVSSWLDRNNYNVNSKAGSNGSSGSSSNAMGILYTSDTLTIDAKGGSASETQSKGGAAGRSLYDSMNSGAYCWTAGGSAGGGAGGNGYPAFGIGTGGAGGGGGGGGASADAVVRYANDNANYRTDAKGGYGGKGYVDGLNGNRADSRTLYLSWAQGTTKTASESMHPNSTVKEGGAGGTAGGSSQEYASTKTDGLTYNINYLDVDGTPIASYDDTYSVGTISELTLPDYKGHSWIIEKPAYTLGDTNLTGAPGEPLSGTVSAKDIYGNIVFKAVPNTYKMTLDHQNGTNVSEFDIVFNSEISSIDVPNKDYFTFNGYYESENGQGICIFDEEGNPSIETWTFDENITFYAYWIKTIENFSKEFLVKTTTGNYCDKTKGIDLDKSIQDDLFTSFSMVDSDGKTTFKNAEWIRGHSQIYENDIVEAKSRYCYMVVELGINDFLNLFTKDELKALMHRRSIVSLFNDGEDGTSIILVASLSILAITTISAYILFRKRKEE